MGPISVGPAAVMAPAVPVEAPGGAPAAAVTIPHVAVFADEEISTDPEAPGAVAADTFTVPPDAFSAFAMVAVPDTVAVPAFVVKPEVPADPTVPAVVDQDARVPPADTCVTVRTEPAAPGAACPDTLTVPPEAFRAFAMVAVPETVAVPALVAKPARVAVPALVANVARVAVPALVANPATPAEPTVPVVMLQIASVVSEEVSTEPAAAGAAALETLTVPVVSTRALACSARVAVPELLPPPETIVAVWIALPVGT